MKYSDIITIGTYLRTNSGETIKVECIHSKRQCRKIGYHKKDMPTKMLFVRLDQCEPIRLTEDIIRLNAVMDVEVQAGYLFKSFGAFWHSEECYLEYADIQCRYVHELQLLMNLFGEKLSLV